MFPTLLDFNSKHMTAHDTSRSIGRLAQPAMASAKGSFLTGRSWLWLPLPCQDRQRQGTPEAKSAAHHAQMRTMNQNKMVTCSRSQSKLFFGRTKNAWLYCFVGDNEEGQPEAPMDLGKSNPGRQAAS